MEVPFPVLLGAKKTIRKRTPFLDLRSRCSSCKCTPPRFCIYTSTCTRAYVHTYIISNAYTSHTHDHVRICIHVRVILSRKLDHSTTSLPKNRLYSLRFDLSLSTFDFIVRTKTGWSNSRYWHHRITESVRKPTPSFLFSPTRICDVTGNWEKTLFLCVCSIRDAFIIMAFEQTKRIQLRCSVRKSVPFEKLNTSDSKPLRLYLVEINLYCTQVYTGYAHVGFPGRNGDIRNGITTYYTIFSSSRLYAIGRGFLYCYFSQGSLACD